MSTQENSEDAVKLLREEHQTFVNTCFLYCLTFFFFILPIKFGASFLPSTVPSFPESIIYGSWPTYFLTILAGFYLIIAIILFRPGRIESYQFKIILGWLALGIATAAFGYYQYDVLYYFYSLNQAVIAILTGLLVAVCLSSEPRARKFIVAGICGGLLYTVLNGVYQYGWGFDDNIRFYREMEAKGATFPAAQISRIMQKLVFSHFTISNSFAAHIILTLPLAAYIIFKKLSGKNITVCRVFGTSMILFSIATFMSSDNPPLAILTMIIGLLLCFGLDHLPDSAIKLIGALIIVAIVTILALTRSRAGMASFGAGLCIAGIICFKGTKRNFFIGLLVIGIGAGLYLAPKVASFQVRLGYYEALTNMFKEKPLGYGFGSFSEYYNRTKGPGIEESNSPHSFFFGYLGHGGIFAGLAVLAVYFLSLFAILKKDFDPWLKFCIIGGFTSWFLHSQLDFNIMIPGTVAIAAILPMLIIDPEKKDDSQKRKSYSALFTALIPIAITCCYFAIEHSYSQSKYTEFHEMANDIQQPPTLDKVKNAMEMVAEKLPNSTAPYDEASSWAMTQYRKNTGKQDQIQLYAYLGLAEEALKKAVEINPHKSSFYTRLAIVYFENKNYEQTRQMLDKAFELYPFNSAALEIERNILIEWIKREPANPELKIQYIKNRIVTLEISLGNMHFRDHLMISRNQLKRMYDDLDKRVRELYTEIDLIRKSGLKADMEPYIRKIKDIQTEAQKVAGVGG